MILLQDPDLAPDVIPDGPVGANGVTEFGWDPGRFKALVRCRDLCCLLREEWGGDPTDFIADVRRARHDSSRIPCPSVPVAAMLFGRGRFGLFGGVAFRSGFPASFVRPRLPREVIGAVGSLRLPPPGSATPPFSGNSGFRAMEFFRPFTLVSDHVEVKVNNFEKIVLQKGVQHHSNSYRG